MTNQDESGRTWRRDQPAAFVFCSECAKREFGPHCAHLVSLDVLVVDFDEWVVG